MKFDSDLVKVGLIVGAIYYLVEEGKKVVRSVAPIGDVVISSITDFTQGVGEVAEYVTTGYWDDVGDLAIEHRNILNTIYEAMVFSTVGLEYRYVLEDKETGYEYQLVDSNHQPAAGLQVVRYNFENNALVDSSKIVIRG